MEDNFFVWLEYSTGVIGAVVYRSSKQGFSCKLFKCIRLPDLLRVQCIATILKANQNIPSQILVVVPASISLL